jgi:hypothetical protein
VWLATGSTASWGIASDSLSLRLGLVELGHHTLLMSLEYVLGDTFHAKDLNIET